MAQCRSSNKQLIVILQEFVDSVSKKWGKDLQEKIFQRYRPKVWGPDSSPCKPKS